MLPAGWWVSAAAVTFFFLGIPQIFASEGSSHRGGWVP